MAAPVAFLLAPVLTASGATAAPKAQPLPRAHALRRWRVKLPDRRGERDRAVGEKAAGLSQVTFTTGSGPTGPDGSKVSQVIVEAFGQNRLGTFPRR